MTISNKSIRKQDGCLETGVSVSDEQTVEYKPTFEQQLMYKAKSKGVLMDMLYEDTKRKCIGCCNHLGNAFLYSITVTVVVLLAVTIILLATRQFTFHNVFFNIAVNLFLGLSIYLILKSVFTYRRDNLRGYLLPEDTLDIQIADNSGKGREPNTDTKWAIIGVIVAIVVGIITLIGVVWNILKEQ